MKLSTDCFVAYYPLIWPQKTSLSPAKIG